MTLANHDLDVLSTDELVARFQAATLQGQLPQALVDQLRRRPGVALIRATDSTEVTLQKAHAAIRQVEQQAP